MSLDIAVCPICDEEYLAGFRGEHNADYHPDLNEDIEVLQADALQ